MFNRIIVNPKKLVNYCITIILASSITINIAFFVNYHQDIKRGVKTAAKSVLVKLNLRGKPHSYPSYPYSNKPLGYYSYLGSMEPVPCTTISNISEAMELPETLIIPPGKYNVNGLLYNCENEGLYRFVNPLEDNQQRIVYKDNLIALLSSISWIVSHGNSDGSKSLDKLTLKAMKSKLFITCGTISSWAHYLLSINDVGVKSRLVSTLTLDEWNSYNNGHVLIEIYREEYGKWELYDLNQNAYFTTHDGSILSLIDFVRCVPSGEYKINYIASDAELDISGFRNKNSRYDFSFFCEAMINRPREQYKRVIQVPMIKDGEHYYFCLVGNGDVFHNQRRVESYSGSYKYLDYLDFIERFYSSHCSAEREARIREYSR